MAALLRLQCHHGIPYWRSHQLPKRDGITVPWNRAVPAGVVSRTAHTVQQHHTVLHIENNVQKQDFPQGITAGTRPFAYPLEQPHSRILEQKYPADKRLFAQTGFF